jgi:hypothetical protein
MKKSGSAGNHVAWFYDATCVNHNAIQEVRQEVRIFAENRAPTTRKGREPGENSGAETLISVKSVRNNSQFRLTAASRRHRRN